MNNDFYRRLLAVTSAIGAIGVMTGAFGAHFLKSRLAVGELETIKTGVLYLFIHVLATLFIIAVAKETIGAKWLRRSGIAFITGILLFSGSLFLLATQSLTGLPVAGIGFITPLGGLSFMMGWLFLMIYSFKN
jgi:uncharacterized membrane protein YgdD (TMEM256/DUF423 family)